MTLRRTAILGTVLALAATIGVATPVQADNFITVNEPLDELNTDGDCSLREAVRAANTDLVVDGCESGSALISELDIITLPAGTFTLMIAGDDAAAAMGDLDITGFTKIQGVAGQTFIEAGTVGGPSSNGIDRVFEIFGANPVTFQHLTIRNGKVTGGADGGGILRESSGVVWLANVVLSGNNAGDEGGGLWVNGEVKLDNSTVVDNLAGGNGGGLAVAGLDLISDSSTISGNVGESGGGIYAAKANLTNTTISGNDARVNGGGALLSNATLTNVTITGNQADSDSAGGGTGGGVFAEPVGTKAFRNVILANNLAGATPQDCSGTIGAGQGNLLETTTGCTLTGIAVSGQDPLLGPLADNGGLTLTHAIASTSPAMDAGALGNCPVADQRGATRPADGFDADFNAECDIGAYEMQSLRVMTADGVAEGNSGSTPVPITVELPGPAVEDVGFTYETVFQGATPGVDFTGASGNDIIGEGETSVQILLAVLGDTTDEPPEFFGLLISAPSNAVISDDTDSIEILDDDPTKHSADLSLQLKFHLRASGDLTPTDSFIPCRQDRKIKIQKKTPDGWKPVTSVMTNGQGHYVANIPDKTGKYRSKVGKKTLAGDDGGDICRPTKSPERTHSH